jgi:hypothetical protein
VVGKSSHHTHSQHSYRAGFAVGGAALDPRACAGFPSIKRLQPLAPDTRSTKAWSSWSMHRPTVRLFDEASGSTCHHLQSLHNPHVWLIAMILFLFGSKFGRASGARTGAECERIHSLPAI